MKRLLVFCLGVALVSLVATPAFGQGIATTKHDFSGATWNTSGEICIVCHTTHKTDTTVALAPLWNHALTDTLTAFTPYSSSTLDATVGQPGSISILCLSCHDGTVALDSYGGNTGTTFMQPTDTGYIGKALKDDHPVSFVYNASLATTDGELFNPATALANLPSDSVSTIEAVLLFGSAGSATVECASCHDVHNGAGIAKLLRKSNSGSLFCLTCHDK